MQTNKQRSDAIRLSNLIEKNAEIYRDDSDYRNMVDHTVFFTDDERHASMAALPSTEPVYKYETPEEPEDDESR